MRNLITIALIIISYSVVFGQEETQTKVTKEEIKKAESNGEVIEYEKAINVFAAGGVSYRMGKNYNVTISPINRTVQFEDVSSVNFSVTTGFIWNPFTFPYKVTYYKNKEKDWKYEYKRTVFAVALLINVYNLNAGSTKANYASPIDGGFGIGYRKEKFSILGTLEFSSLRQPRKYFIDEYKDKDKTLILFGSNEPTQTISSDDNSIFISKFYTSFGVRIAYTFGKQK